MSTSQIEFAITPNTVLTILLLASTPILLLHSTRKSSTKKPSYPFNFNHPERWKFDFKHIFDTAAFKQVRGKPETGKAGNAGQNWPFGVPVLASGNLAGMATFSGHPVHTPAQFRIAPASMRRLQLEF